MCLRGMNANGEQGENETARAKEPKVMKRDVTDGVEFQACAVRVNRK